ncbi:hypothetical protein Bca4012_084173 [Brassica carinata]
MNVTLGQFGGLHSLAIVECKSGDISSSVTEQVRKTRTKFDLPGDISSSVTEQVRKTRTKFDLQVTRKKKSMLY